MNTLSIFLFSILSTQYGLHIQKTFETPELESGMLNARGKLLKFSLNEDDEFEFSLVVLKEK